MAEPLTWTGAPTDVVVFLKSGAWNITNGDEIPRNSVNRAIVRGLLLAALERLDDPRELLATATPAPTLPERERGA